MTSRRSSWRVPRAQVVAVAKRPAQPDPDTVLAGPGHVVLLEDPRHLGNLGAVIRVAAAAGAAGVMTTGRQDPWHPDALRGSAGLHFALPVHHLRAVRTGGRELIALDPDGEPLSPRELPAAAVLAFGTERDGLSDELLAQATRGASRCRCPRGLVAQPGHGRGCDALRAEARVVVNGTWTREGITRTCEAASRGRLWLKVPSLWMLKPTICNDPSQRFGKRSIIAPIPNLYSCSAQFVGLSRFAGPGNARSCGRRPRVTESWRPWRRSNPARTSLLHVESDNATERIAICSDAQESERLL